MTNKKQNHRKEDHSFYKEAKNSFFGESQLSGEKILKNIKKAIKWSFYGYLIVATLWGCVNQFRNPTSQNVTQGIEFFRTTDEVWSNLYQSQTSTTYSVTTEGIAYHTDYERVNRDYEVFNKETIEDNEDWAKEYTGETSGETQTLAQLDFFSINPHFYFDGQEGDEEIEDYDAAEWVNTQDGILKVGDLQTQQGKANSKSYGYQASSADAYGFVSDVLLVDLEEADSEMFSEDFVVQSWTVPIGLQIINQVEDEDGDESLANTWTKFFGANDIFQGDDIHFITDEDGEVEEDDNGFSIFDQTNWYIVIDESYLDRSNSNFSNVEENLFKFIPKINLANDEDDNGVVTAQLKYMLNLYAFNNPELSVNEKTVLELKDGEQETAEDIFADMTGDSDFTYNAILPNGLIESTYPSDMEFNFGNQLFIYAQEKGSPIIPTDNTLDTMDELRTEAVQAISTSEGVNYNTWDDLDTNNGTGHDARTNNMGWGVVDADGEIVTLTNSSEEESYLWGLNRSTNHGHITNELLSDDPELSKYVLTEQNYNYQVDNANGNEWMVGNEFGAYVGEGSDQKTLEFENEQIYLGMQQQNELGFNAGSTTYPRGPSQRGILRPVYWDAPVGSNNYVWEERTYADEYGEGEEYWRRNVTTPNEDYSYEYEPTAADYATQAISSSGEDPENKTRVVFASWSDWSKAWGPNFGPMHGTFVFPLAMVSLEVESWFPYSTFGAWGVLLGVFIIIFVLRGLGTLVSWKSHDNQQKMQEVQTKVAEIKSRYEKYDKSNKQMKQKQQQEIMALYKKNDVNPFASFGSLFLTMPIFLSMWTIISSIVTYKVASIGAFSFAATPFFGMFNIGNMFIFYLFVAIGVGLSQGVSSKLPSWLADRRNGVKRLDEATLKARKKQNKMSNIMVGVFVFMGLTIPTLLAFYWMISALFTISLELLRHYLKIRKANEVTSSNAA